MVRVKIAVFSDVHANWEAWEAVKADIVAEKVDQSVTSGFIGNGVTEGAVGSTTGFKATPTNVYYPQSADGFYRVLQLGALELLPSGANLNITGNIANGGVAALKDILI